jgi:hypothetical protein
MVTKVARPEPEKPLNSPASTLLCGASSSITLTLGKKSRLMLQLAYLNLSHFQPHLLTLLSG